MADLSFKECCDRVVAAAKVKKSGDIMYAATYASAGLRMTDPEEIRVQILYILNNLSGWRGPEAKETKDAFKKLGKKK